MKVSINMQKVKLYMRASVVFLLLITMLLSGCSGSLTVLKRAVDEKEYAKEYVVFDADIKDADGFRALMKASMD